MSARRLQILVPAFPDGITVPCASCPEAFFDESDQDARHLAKRVCQECPVRDACSEFAVKHREYGIWGGMTRQERHNEQRRRRRAAALAVDQDKENPV